jgi:hypothetical protein
MNLSSIKPLIGSRNSMSYLEPIGTLGKMKAMLFKSQRISIKEQYYKYGVRVFDFRLFFNDSGRCYFKHGTVWHESFSLFNHLSFLDRQGDCMVRVILEETDNDSQKPNIEYIEERFKTICRIIETIYVQIKFFGGKRLYDGITLYNFKNNGPIIEEAKSNSMIVNMIPLWKAKKVNKRFIDKETSADCVMMDFVDITE